MSVYRHIYVHVPFCEVICHYCHFYTARAKDADQEGFFRALKQDLALQEHLLAPDLEAVYFGGGTPAASPPELLAAFLEYLRPRLTARTEITLEANPTVVEAGLARAWREAGINRVSLGVQSLDDKLLKRLGRVHSAEEAKRALGSIRAEIQNVSCDLMYAVPGQGDAQPGEEALELVGLGANHLSAYHLTLEKDHFLHPGLPPDDYAWRQIHGIAERLAPLGFRHYEVASFAAPGCESLNNKNYWAGGPYLAFGPSAHGFDGSGERWSNVSDWREYVRRAGAGESTRAWTERLTPEQRKIEVIFTSLRTDQGLDLETFRLGFGVDLLAEKEEMFARWQEEGLGRVVGSRFVLTFAGFMLADEIAKSLI